MLPRHHPDRIRIAFDDHRLVANAGLILPATLARRLGLPELVHNQLDLGRAPGRANTGDKMMTLVASALAGGDCIDDADVLRTGGTARALGGTVKAPSTLGTFLRPWGFTQPSLPAEGLHGQWPERQREAWRGGYLRKYRISATWSVMPVRGWSGFPGERRGAAPAGYLFAVPAIPGPKGWRRANGRSAGMTPRSLLFVPPPQCWAVKGNSVG